MKDFFKKIMEKPTYLPKQLISQINLKYESNKYEKSAQYNWEQLHIPTSTIQTIKYKLQQKEMTTPAVLINVEKELVNKIKRETALLNKNNITRTKAYYEYYKKNPEIHWALLAHLVSRNGGWNMTDLKGFLLTQLMSENQAHHFFMFLERANFLIFKDAYPQLLLYEASKKINKNLFHLLPHLGVSMFMKPCWDLFYKKKDSKLITIALIINEQHYIEIPVMQNSIYKKKVLDSLLFQTQELFQLTYVIIPYIKNKDTRISGAAMENFSNVSYRIAFGKKLYAILFGIESLYRDSMEFVSGVTHTGSRADYWPQFFSARKMMETIHPNFNDHSKNSSIFSPELESAWPNIKHSPHNQIDWYENESILTHFKPISIPKHFEITPNYRSNLNKILTLQNILKK